MKLLEHPAVRATMKERRKIIAERRTPPLLIVDVGNGTFDEIRTCSDIIEHVRDFDRSLDGSIDLPGIGRFVRNAAVGADYRIREVEGPR